jgi:hypothetical protein
MNYEPGANVPTFLPFNVAFPHISIPRDGLISTLHHLFDLFSRFDTTKMSLRQKLIVQHFASPTRWFLDPGALDFFGGSSDDPLTPFPVLIERLFFIMHNPSLDSLL